MRPKLPAQINVGEASGINHSHPEPDWFSDPGKGTCTRSMVSCMATKKVTVTIPEDLLDEIRADAAERGLSAYVAEALRFKRDRDRLQELVDWLQEEHGPVTDDEHAEALEALADLDAEHERRHATAKRNAGDAA